MIPKECIIIGGGQSIQTGLSLGLKKQIKNKFVITCNYAFNYFDSTFNLSVDVDFYKNNLDKLKSLTLVIANNNIDPGDLLPNTILIRGINNYYKNIKNGFYKPTLCGIMAIHLAMYLMDYDGSIYILGYDWTRTSNVTHFYSKEEINHPGQGAIDFYKRHSPEYHFKPFLSEKNINIYNVIGEPDSNIQCFEKRTYIQFFEQLASNTYNKIKLSKEIKEKLNKCS